MIIKCRPNSIGHTTVPRHRTSTNGAKKRLVMPLKIWQHVRGHPQPTRPPCVNHWGLPAALFVFTIDRERGIVWWKTPKFSPKRPSKRATHKHPHSHRCRGKACGRCRNSTIRERRKYKERSSLLFPFTCRWCGPRLLVFPPNGDGAGGIENHTHTHTHSLFFLQFLVYFIFYL